jgi:hypothetical protein
MSALSPRPNMSSAMFSSSACRSPRIPGAWPGIDATGAGRSPRVSSSRPYSALSRIGNDARSFPRPAILPQVSVLPLPRQESEAHAVLSSTFSTTFIAIVEIRQVREAPIGAMGSAPTRGPCHGHTLRVSGRRKSGGGRFHTGK